MPGWAAGTRRHSHGNNGRRRATKSEGYSGVLSLRTVGTWAAEVLMKL